MYAGSMCGKKVEVRTSAGESANCILHSDQNPQLPRIQTRRILCPLLLDPIVSTSSHVGDIQIHANHHHVQAGRNTHALHDDVLLCPAAMEGTECARQMDIVGNYPLPIATVHAQTQLQTTVVHHQVQQ